MARKARPLRLIKTLLLLGLLGFGALLLLGYSRNHPEDMPWTELDLTQPVGAFTGRKLADLRGDFDRCQGLLGRAGIRYTALPPRSGGEQCGYDDAVRLRPGGALDIAYRPADLGTSCSVAAALALWEWHVVQPAESQNEKEQQGFDQPKRASLPRHQVRRAVAASSAVTG